MNPTIQTLLIVFTMVFILLQVRDIVWARLHDERLDVPLSLIANLLTSALMAMLYVVITSAVSALFGLAIIPSIFPIDDPGDRFPGIDDYNEGDENEGDDDEAPADEDVW